MTSLTGHDAYRSMLGITTILQQVSNHFLRDMYDLTKILHAGASILLVKLFVVAEVLR